MMKQFIAFLLFFAAALLPSAVAVADDGWKEYGMVCYTSARDLKFYTNAGEREWDEEGDSRPERFAKGVNTLMAEGWQPLGGVSQRARITASPFCQAMVRD